MILWDEDPYTLQSGESRCFIAVPSSSSKPSIDIPPLIEGKYAIFNTASFELMDIEAWHSLAFLLLELDKVEMLFSTFIEFYSRDSLDQMENFYTNKIALPIE